MNEQILKMINRRHIKSIITLIGIFLIAPKSMASDNFHKSPCFQKIFHTYIETQYPQLKRDESSINNQVDNFYKFFDLLIKTSNNIKQFDPNIKVTVFKEIEKFPIDVRIILLSHAFEQSSEFPDVGKFIKLLKEMDLLPSYIKLRGNINFFNALPDYITGGKSSYQPLSKNLTTSISTLPLNNKIEEIFTNIDINTISFPQFRKKIETSEEIEVLTDSELNFYFIYITLKQRINSEKRGRYKSSFTEQLQNLATDLLNDNNFREKTKSFLLENDQEVYQYLSERNFFSSPKEKEKIIHEIENKFNDFAVNNPFDAKTDEIINWPKSKDFHEVSSLDVHRMSMKEFLTRTKSVFIDQEMSNEEKHFFYIYIALGRRRQEGIAGRLTTNLKSSLEEFKEVLSKNNQLRGQIESYLQINDPEMLSYFHKNDIINYKTKHNALDSLVAETSTLVKTNSRKIESTEVHNLEIKDIEKNIEEYMTYFYRLVTNTLPTEEKQIKIRIIDEDGLVYDGITAAFQVQKIYLSQKSFFSNKNHDISLKLFEYFTEELKKGNEELFDQIFYEIPKNEWQNWIKDPELIKKMTNKNNITALERDIELSRYTDTVQEILNKSLPHNVPMSEIKKANEIPTKTELQELPNVSFEEVSNAMPFITRDDYETTYQAINSLHNEMLNSLNHIKNDSLSSVEVQEYLSLIINDFLENLEIFSITANNQFLQNQTLDSFQKSLESIIHSQIQSQKVDSKNKLANEFFIVIQQHQKNIEQFLKFENIENISYEYKLRQSVSEIIENLKLHKSPISNESPTKISNMIVQTIIDLDNTVKKDWPLHYIKDQMSSNLNLDSKTISNYLTYILPYDDYPLCLIEWGLKRSLEKKKRFLLEDVKNGILALADDHVINSKNKSILVNLIKEAELNPNHDFHQLLKEINSRPNIDGSHDVLFWKLINALHMAINKETEIHVDLSFRKNFLSWWDEFKQRKDIDELRELKPLESKNQKQTTTKKNEKLNSNSTVNISSLSKIEDHIFTSIEKRLAEEYKTRHEFEISKAKRIELELILQKENVRPLTEEDYKNIALYVYIKLKTKGELVLSQKELKKFRNLRSDFVNDLLYFILNTSHDDTESMYKLKRVYQIISSVNQTEHLTPFSFQNTYSQIKNHAVRHLSADQLIDYAYFNDSNDYYKIRSIYRRISGTGTQEGANSRILKDGFHVASDENLFLPFDVPRRLHQNLGIEKYTKKIFTIYDTNIPFSGKDCIPPQSYFSKKNLCHELVMEVENSIDTLKYIEGDISHYACLRNFKWVYKDKCLENGLYRFIDR